MAHLENSPFTRRRRKSPLVDLISPPKSYLEDSPPRTKKSPQKDLIVEEEKHSDGGLGLLIAAETGDIETIKTLLDSGADLNIRTHDGSTALMIASEKGYYDIVKLLLESGVDPKVKKNNGFTALMVALKNKHKNIVKLLSDYINGPPKTSMLAEEKKEFVGGVGLVGKIFNAPRVHDEAFYFGKPPLELQQIFKNPTIQEKIWATEMCLQQSDLFLKILNIIPMDSDLLYYYKFILSGSVDLPFNCFLLNETISPDKCINFLSFITVHVTAEPDRTQVGKDTDFFLAENLLYKKLMVCDKPNSDEFLFCGSLAKILSYKLIGIVNENCKKYDNDPQTLRGLSCHFKESFVPVPTTQEQLHIFKTLIDISLSSGAYGAVFESTLPHTNVKVATKIPLSISERTLYEAVASLCIINDYIDRFPEFSRAYTYCYGLFSCPAFEVSKYLTKQKFKSEVAKNLCQYQDGATNLYEVYQKVDGVDINSILKGNPSSISLENFKIILKKLLLQLIPLQEGPYKFTHGDLHGGNVMLNTTNSANPDVYIIDYGLSSYEISGIHFYCYTEANFLGYYLPKKNIVSGVYDLFCFLKSIHYYTKDGDPLNKYVTKIIYYILSPGFKDKNNKDLDPSDVMNGPSHLYTSDECKIAKGSEHNVKVMEERTYLWIYRELQKNQVLKMDDSGDSDALRVLEMYAIPKKSCDSFEATQGDIRTSRGYPEHKESIVEWITDVLKEKNGSKPAISFAISLLNKWEKCSTMIWRLSYFQVIGCACLYITGLVFGGFSETTPEKLAYYTADMFTPEEVIEYSRILFREIYWDILP